MLLFSPHAPDYPTPASDFERQVFDFCQKWKDGVTHFEFMTSGSTGLPKSILIPREAMIASARLTGDWLHLHPNDVALLCLPVHYIAGAMVLVRALELELSLVLVEPNVNPLLGITPFSIQLASFVPNQWHAMLKDKLDLAAFFSNAKGVLLGGASLSPSLLAQTTEFKFPVYLTFGMTETVSHVAFQQLSPTYSPHFSWLPGVAHQVGEHGCVSIKSDATSQQWIQTNDLIEPIDATCFSLLGRVDRVINSAGRKIQAEKVEKELGYLFPDRSFFIGSIPDDSLGQKAVLFVEGSAVIDERSLRLPTLESWEIPKDVIYLSKFETTGSGKMDRHKSVALYLNAQK